MEAFFLVESQRIFHKNHQRFYDFWLHRAAKATRLDGKTWALGTARENHPVEVLKMYEKVHVKALKTQQNGWNLQLKKWTQPLQASET